MDSGGGRCYDNARCESVIVIMKEEMFYSHKENLKIMISDLPVGTHLRVRTSNNNNHSIVLAGKTDTTITVYDANGCGSNSSLLEAGSSNYSGHCQINKQVFTYKNFAKRYPRLDYMHKGA